VRGPAILGEGALLVDAEVGPWTSVGPRVVIERSRVERSVLLEGSRIADIPHVRDSLIGRRVVVHPKASGHGVLSLFLGDDCRVEVPR
jgi:glucose-1-phosphate thymidylyltransferase